jgi:hypothetical protein
MPNIRRRRHAQRSNGLTDTQHEILMIGFGILSPGPGFTSEAEARRAWFAFKDEIICDFGDRPSQRPAGFSNMNWRARRSPCIGTRRYVLCWIAV